MRISGSHLDRVVVEPGQSRAAGKIRPVGTCEDRKLFTMVEVGGRIYPSRETPHEMVAVSWLRSRVLSAVANDLQHKAVGIDEVCGVVIAVLGELTRAMYDLGVVTQCPVVCLADDRAVRHHEGQVL